MPKLTEFKKTTGESMIIYGDPKTGKTLRAGKLAKKFKILYIDLENSVQTLLTHLSEEEKANVEVLSIPDAKTNPVAVRTLMKVFTGRPTNVCWGHGVVDCITCKKNAPNDFTNVHLNSLSRDWIVVVDSLSQLNDSSYSLIQNGNIDYKFEWQDWERHNQNLAMILSQVQQAPYHSVWISHANMVDMPDGKTKIVPIGGTRNFSSRIAKFFSHVIYVEVSSGKFKTGSTPTYALNVVSGNRAGLVVDDDKVTLADLFIAGNAVSTTTGISAGPPAEAEKSSVTGVKSPMPKIVSQIVVKQ